MEYFDILPVEVCKDGELLCKKMFHVLRKINRDCF